MKLDKNNNMFDNQTFTTRKHSLRFVFFFLFKEKRKTDRLYISILVCGLTIIANGYFGIP